MASSSSMKDYNIGILDVKKPLDCSCQELLSMPNIVMSGWLRKRALRNKFITMNWPKEYVVVANRSLYYFSSETAKKASGSFSLYGFNRIRREHGLKVKDKVWAFKLEHIQPTIRSLYFSASSEKEMVIWMRAIKKEMLQANGKEACTTYSTAADSQYGESIASEDSWGSSDYNFLESSIYEEPVDRRMSTMFDRNSDYQYQCAPIKIGKDSDFEDGSPAVKSKPQALPSAPEMPVYDIGYSVEKPVSPQIPISKSKVDYWSSVRFEGSKVEASEIISAIGEDGVYLVRKSEDNSDVLVVYAGQVKKYKVSLDKSNGKMALSAREPAFDNMEALLYHYYTNNLPSGNQKLNCPFKLHDEYLKIMVDDNDHPYD